MSEYRDNKPDYTESNREKQRIRNQKRVGKSSDGVIIKIDLATNKSESYVITPIEQAPTGKIVKMDTLSLNSNSTSGIQLLVHKRSSDNDCKSGHVIAKDQLYKEVPPTHLNESH